VKPPHPHLHVVPHAPANDAPPPVRWWEALEFLALREVRHAMVGGAVPARPAETPEESARHAVFWALFELEHLVRRFVARLEAGERVRIRWGIFKHETGRVDFDLRIVEETDLSGDAR
jgi:hypothetical protein